MKQNTSTQDHPSSLKTHQATAASKESLASLPPEIKALISEYLVGVEEATVQSLAHYQYPRHDLKPIKRFRKLIHQYSDSENFGSSSLKDFLSELENDEMVQVLNSEIVRTHLPHKFLWLFLTYLTSKEYTALKQINC